MHPNDQLLAEHGENPSGALASVQRIQRGKRFKQKGSRGFHRDGLL